MDMAEPMCRPGTPEDVAEAVLKVCSEAAAACSLGTPVCDPDGLAQGLRNGMNPEQAIENGRIDRRLLAGHHFQGGKSTDNLLPCHRIALPSRDASHATR